MARFFISYSRQDGKELASTLRSSIALLDSSHDIFLDERSIEIGVDWEDRITRSIKTSDYFVLIISPSSTNSEWVKKEVQIAKESELKSGMKKLFVIKDNQTPFPDYLPQNNQVLELTDNWCIDFYRLMSGIFANQSFYSIEEEILTRDDGYDIDLWVSCSPQYLELIHSVEYRFDYGFNQANLKFQKVLLKKNKNDSKTAFPALRSLRSFLLTVPVAKNTGRV
jgi:hypothetical protein